MKILDERKLGRTGLPVSALGLGTTEIGYTYGLGPRDVPDEKTAIDLLQRAVDLGVSFIDTAHSYGLAEERIRKSGIGKKPNIIIATKCCLILDKTDDVEPEAIQKEMREEVEESLRVLDFEILPLVQLHGGSVKIIKSGLIQETMQKLKDEGKVKFVGISVRGEEAALAAIDSGFFDTLQIAHSILDQRMTKIVLPKALEKNVGIINRSVLLKGALTPASKYLVEGLTPLKKKSDEAARIAEEIGTDLPSLAIRFAYSNPAVSTVLVGSNKIKNIENSVKAIEAGPLPSEILEKLKLLAIDDPMQIDPSKWKHWDQPRDGKK